jgi:hypothetical protein
LQMRQDWSSLVRLAKSSPEEPIQSLGKQYWGMSRRHIRGPTRRWRPRALAMKKMKRRLWSRNRCFVGINPKVEDSYFCREGNSSTTWQIIPPGGQEYINCHNFSLLLSSTGSLAWFLFLVYVPIKVVILVNLSSFQLFLLI